jgi:DNA polymerase-3 subunit gamma/tau
MSYTVLARKYRPQIFADLVGQEHVSRTLGNAISSGRVAHAFLFTGARGVGKTTTARLLAKALNCGQGPTPTPCGVCDACREIAAGTDLDVLEIDGASNNGVDDVRRLQETLPFRPARDRFKIVIVDEVHMLSSGAFNAFLKTLEEPPSHVKFIFATTEVHKVPITIRSRCQRYDFRLIPHAVVASKVREILAAEKVEADDTAIALVAREAAGSMRDALTVLDQLLALSGAVLRGESVASGLGIASRSHVFGCLEALLSGDAAECLRSVSTMVEQGLDTLHFAKQLLECARDLVVLRVVGDADDLVELAPDEHERAQRLARAHERPELERLFAGLAKLVEEVGEAGMPQMSLEMGLVRLADRPPLVALSELVDRLRGIEQRLMGGGPAQGPAAGGGGGSAARSPLKRGPGPEAAAPRSARVAGGRPDEPGMTGPSASGSLSATGLAVMAAGVALATPAAAVAMGRPALAAVGLAVAPHVEAPTAAFGLEAAAQPELPPTAAIVAPPTATGVQAPPAPDEPVEAPTEAAESSAPTTMHGDATPAVTTTGDRPASGDTEPASVSMASGMPDAAETGPAWPRIVNQVKASQPALGAVLDHGVPIEVTPEALRIGFADGSFFGRQAQNANAREAILRAAQQVLGARPALTIGPIGASKTATLAQTEENTRRTHTAARREVALKHPSVVDAMEVFEESAGSVDVQVDSE